MPNESSSATSAAFFSANGYVVVRKALPLEMVAELRASLENLAELARAQGALASAGSASGPVWQVVSVHRHVPEVLAVLRRESIARTAAACLEAARVQLLQDAVVLKPARDGGSIDWHQDHTYTGYLRPARLLSVRLALGIEDGSRGGLRVLAGSHRWGIARTDGFGSSALNTDELAAARRSIGDDAIAAATRAVDLQPGDVSMHHCLTFHGSVENRAGSQRTTLVAHMFDAACRLDEERLQEAQRGHFPTDDDGHLLPAAFPFVLGDYKRRTGR